MSQDDSHYHCNTIYHLARITGHGSEYVLPLYDESRIISGDSGRFFASMVKLAEFLNCERRVLYPAADLLCKSGFWEVLSEIPGKTVQYKSYGHEEWSLKHPERAEAECCKKLHMPWDDEEQDPLGTALFGITGGVTYFPTVLTGWRKYGSDEFIKETMKLFMESDAVKHTHDRENLSSRLPHTKSRAFRKKFGEFLKEMAAKKL